MKSKKRILYFFMFLPLAVTLIALLFLPDQIPAHYGWNHQVDRWGSKYETLLMPLITILMGFFMIGISKFSSQYEKNGQNNQNVSLTAGILTVILFNLMTYYFLYMAFNSVENLSLMSIDIFQLLFMALGIMLIIIGNVMPKVRMNSLFGLRTSWSMKNEIAWKKSQRFGGISFMIVGLLMIMISIFTTGWLCFLLSIGALIVSLPFDVYYSYKAAKESENQ